MKQVKNFIGNEFVAAHDNQWVDKISPATQEVISQIPRSRKSDVEQAVQVADNVFAKWSSLSGVQRGEYLFKIANELENRREDIAKVVAAECGKSYNDAYGEVGAAISQGRYMAGEGARMGGRIIESGSGLTKKCYVTREPLGVAALIIASNTPIANVAWKVFPALIAGNTCVLKASEDTPETANLFAECALKAGLPAGTLNIVHGLGNEAGQALIESEGIGVISFTGSTRVGRHIQKSVGERLIKVFLELGGKNPLVVWEDADIDLAMDWCLKSSFTNAGQRCASSSRIIIHEKIYDQFRDRFVEETKKLSIGPENTDYLGPVINERQMKNMLSIVENSSGDVLVGGKRYGDKGFYVEPTIIENVDPNSELAQTELFGPIAALFKAASFDEMIELVNNSSYGLTSSIHTQNINTGFEFCRRVKAGVATVNGGTHGSEPHFPFGGVKDSGNGLREPGTEALDVYTEKKNIVITHSFRNNS